MDQEEFDALTRSVASGLGSRRHALRALGGGLLGGALGGVATCLGSTDIVEATKAKQQRAKPKHKQQPQAERNAHEQLQAAGKGKHKGKGHGKHHDKKPKECDGLVKLCQQCEKPVCIDGDWVCVSNGEKSCRDGSCALRGECCPGEGHCNQCEQPVCADGDWVCRTNGQKPCLDGTCIPEDACCPNAPIPDCAECQEAVCTNGELVCRPKANCVYCPPDWTVHCGEGCCSKDHYFLDPESGRHKCETDHWGGWVWCD
jgi:hypothetical protein